MVGGGGGGGGGAGGLGADGNIYSSLPTSLNALRPHDLTTSIIASIAVMANMSVAMIRAAVNRCPLNASFLFPDMDRDRECLLQARILCLEHPKMAGESFERCN